MRTLMRTGIEMAKETEEDRRAKYERNFEEIVAKLIKQVRADQNAEVANA